jgi:molybdopterin synthase catalytic subunit
MALPRLAVTPAVLDPQALASLVSSTSAAPVGAVATFVGLVRAENLGRRVRFLEYEAYDALAVRSFARIERELGERFPQVVIGVHHRTGRLGVGDASVAIAVASPHRADAFVGCRYAIERIKQIAPIWKHEYFDEGEVWIEGATADPDDESARAEAWRRSCA